MNDEMQHFGGNAIGNNPILRLNENSRNPLQLAPVIGCIFKYLSLEDIKNCRYVCPAWNAVGQSLLRSRSRVIFLKNNVGQLDREILFSPSNFLNRFSETLEAMPFTAFSISGYSIHYPWTVEELSEFFLSEHENIRDLVLENLYLTLGGKRVESFDITPWIANLALTRANARHRSRLEVMGSPRGRTIIHSSALVYVKELSISRCQINLQDPFQFHPIKLKLSDVVFFKEGKKIPDLLCINDIVDLSEAKYIHLEYSDHRIENTKLSLDLQGNLDLDYLRLNDITLANWKNCTWTVNKLIMDDQPFLEETKMKIKELHLYFQAIDISALPRSLVKLRIHSAYGISCSNLPTTKIILDNVHSLTLTGLQPNVLSAIIKFLEFPNLVNLYLMGDNEQPAINSDWIPNTVKRLKLGNIKVTCVNERTDFNLEKLILSGYSLLDVKRICTIVNPTKVLVLHFRDEAETHANIPQFLEFLRSNEGCSNQECILIGPFHWNRFPFKGNPLAAFVDWPAKYYAFLNKKGQALLITEPEQFAEFEKSDPMYPDVEITPILSS